MLRSDQNPALLRAVATELKARRVALGLSQYGLAHESDVHRTFISKLEMGVANPSLTALYRLAEGLEVEPAELVKAISKRYRKELRSEALAKGS